MSEIPPKPPSIRQYSSKQGPLSFSQESLWFLFQLDTANLAYNLVYLFRLTGGLEQIILEYTLNEIVRRHEILRTTYSNRAGQPVQMINPFVPFPLPELDFTALPQGEVMPAVSKYALEQGIKPFDLQKGTAGTVYLAARLCARKITCFSPPITSTLTLGQSKSLSTNWCNGMRLIDQGTRKEFWIYQSNTWIMLSGNGNG